MLFVFFFFKQKTAYEIPKRDWSSDVCSSDLAGGGGGLGAERGGGLARAGDALSGAGAEPGDAGAAQRRLPAVPPGGRAGRPGARRRQGGRARGGVPRRGARVGTRDRIERPVHIRPLRAGRGEGGGGGPRAGVRRAGGARAPPRRIPPR